MSSLSVCASQNSLRFSSVLPSSMEPVISLALVSLGEHLPPVLSSMLSLKGICIMFMNHVRRPDVRSSFNSSLCPMIFL